MLFEKFIQFVLNNLWIPAFAGMASINGNKLSLYKEHKD